MVLPLSDFKKYALRLFLWNKLHPISVFCLGRGKEVDGVDDRNRDDVFFRTEVECSYSIDDLLRQRGRLHAGSLQLTQGHRSARFDGQPQGELATQRRVLA